jgi:hypothetical protein
LGMELCTCNQELGRERLYEGVLFLSVIVNIFSLHVVLQFRHGVHLVDVCSLS